LLGFGFFRGRLLGFWLFGFRLPGSGKILSHCH